MHDFYPLYKKSAYIPNGYIQCQFPNCPPTHTIFHQHEYFEIELILSGHGEAIIDGMSYPLCQGSLLFMSPLNVESLCGDSECSLISIAFSEGVCDDLLLSTFCFEKSATILQLSESDYKFIKPAVWELLHHYDDKPFALLLLNTIVTKLSKVYTGQSKAAFNFSNLQRAILYIINNFKKNISLEDVASHTGLSPVYLSAQMKKELGLSFKEYLDSLRFNHAQSLLQFSSMTIQQICAESGFSNYENFIRRFTKRIGVSPQKYRSSLISKK